MKWSKMGFRTLRENPADAEMESHRLLVRSGAIKKMAPGIFSYGVMFLRSLRKFENIVRGELQKADAHEILMPMVQPAELWKKSGRWPVLTELLKFKNKNNHDFCLGATHEEAVVDFAKNDIKSYKDLPNVVYQIQTKYRDEIRPRFGLMRGREFIMKDAYSFDVSPQAALENYSNIREAYVRIFNKLGVDFRIVQAHSGAIGGDQSHEFQVLADAGMDTILTCENCDYVGNVEVVPVEAPSEGAVWTTDKLEKFPTPGLRTIEDLSENLKIASKDLVKTFFVKYQDQRKKWRTATLLVPGDREVNLLKVQTVVEALGEIEPLSDVEVLKLTGASPGSCGPVGLENKIILDPLLESLNGFVVGANLDDFHLRNVVPERDFEVTLKTSIIEAREGDPCPNCKEPLVQRRGIEVGHIFYLGQKYSKPLGLQFLDENGKSQSVEMGCYGIGVTRSLQAIVEQSHDSDGIIWPKSVAPFDIHGCLLDPDDPLSQEVFGKIAKGLQEKGLEVFVDDRKERPGIKFKDADLLGLPLRIVLGKRGLENGEIELFVRKDKAKSSCKIEGAVEHIAELMESCF